MTIGIPAIDRDPSWKAVIDLLDRWQELPVERVLAWHMPSADVATLAHLAYMLGVGDVDLSIGDPLVVLRQAVDLRKRRGTGFALREGLKALGYAAESFTLTNKQAWLHDGTINRAGMYRYGGDNHWAIIVTTIELDAWPTLDQVKLAWRALARNKSRRDHLVLRLRFDGATIAIYRAEPTSVPHDPSSAPPPYEMPGQVHLWRGDAMSLSGSNVLGVADQVGTLDMVASATRPTATTIAGQAGWDFAANSMLSASGVVESIGSGALLVVGQRSPLTGARYLVSTGRSGAPTTMSLRLFTENTALSARRLSSGSDVVENPTTNDPTATLFTWSPTSAEMWRDGVLVASSAVAVAVVDIEMWALGGSPTATGLAEQAVQAEVRVGTQHLTGDDVTDLFAYTAARYGLG